MSDAMETLFVSKEARLRRSDNTLSVTVNGRSRSYPIEKVKHIVLLSESELNSRLLCLCGQYGVRVSFFDYYGYFKGAFEPIDGSPSGRVKLEQAKSVLNKDSRMALAREFVRGAAHNMQANLLYYTYRGNIELAETLKEMSSLVAKIDKTPDTATLMGIEGNLHEIYYAGWKYVDPELDFGHRVRRPPNNPINCLISFLNQMTYTIVRHETSKTHLDETLSWLHSPGSGRASVSLDLAEPFKPVLTDALVFRMVRKKMIETNWFDQKPGVCLLTETGRRHVAEQFSVRLEETYRDRSFREWVYREALKIERHLLGVAEYESFTRKV
jgi:CRISPR-associated protein Cas1